MEFLRKVEIYAIPIFLVPLKGAEVILLVQGVKAYFILLDFL